MADYKDIILGTLSNLADKARDFAKSDKVSSIVDKVKDSADSSGVRGVYDQGASRAKAYGRIAKLNLEINGQQQELSRVFAEIGRLYYEQAKAEPQGFFAALFSQAEGLDESLKAKEEEIHALKEALRAEPVDADIEVEIGDFEEIVDATEADGAGAEE